MLQHMTAAGAQQNHCYHKVIINIIIEVRIDT